MDAELRQSHDGQPQRLSALYQYHNAPEVAPAHGLEYDDAPYPHSDKYPVIRELNYADSYHGKHAYTNNNNRPPRIIFGMKVPTFLMVAAVMVLVVVGAAVGGAVGGRTLRTGVTDNGMSIGTPTPATTSSASQTATSSSTAFSAPTPTYTPISDCPTSNDTSYMSSYAKGSSGTVPANAGLNFTKYCDLRSPLSDPSASRIAEAFVYTFSDCVELCAGYNFWNAGTNCSVAVYQVGGSRPGNCWIGTSKTVKANALGVQEGTDVALLDLKS